MDPEKIIPKLEEISKLLRKFDKPLTFKEAYKYLGLSPSYLYKLTSQNRIPYYKPSGKMIYFMKTELDAWVYSNKNNTN